MAFEHGKKLTFFDLQKRLGRKNQGADLFAAASADVPVVFVAFDLLWLNGRSLLKTPLRERRDLLRGVKLPNQFQMAEISPAHSAARNRAVLPAREAAFERRTDDQGSAKFLLARPTGNVLVQTKERTRNARCGSGRRRTGTWKTQSRAQHVIAFPMSQFCGDNYHIECCEFFL